jgi:hydrogenase maturation protease
LTSESERRGLVLGLGNDILSDDAVGLFATRELGEIFGDLDKVDFIETTEMGLSLLDFLEGRRWAIIVDSILTGDCEPGGLHMYDRSMFLDPQAKNPHHMGMDEILALAEETNVSIPSDLSVVAIEVKDPFTFGEELTPELEMALPGIVSEISELVKNRVKENK